MGLGSGVWGFGVTVGRLGVGVEEWVVAVGVRVAVGVGEAVAVVGVRVAAVGEGDAAGVGWRIGGADGWFGIAEAWAGVVDAKIGSADGWFDIADGWRCAVIARWVYGRGRKSAAGMKVVGGTAEVGVAQASSPASLGGVSPPVPTRGETPRELGGGTPAVPRCDATVAGGGLGEDFRLLTSAATGRGTTGVGRRAWDDGRGTTGVGRRAWVGIPKFHKRKAAEVVGEGQGPDWLGPARKERGIYAASTWSAPGGSEPATTRAC